MALATFRSRAVCRLLLIHCLLFPLMFLLFLLLFIITFFLGGGGGEGVQVVSLIMHLVPFLIV